MNEDKNLNNENDNNNNDDKNQKIEIVVGDTTDLNFSEVGDYMGDLRPRDIKGSKKNIIIPTNKKSITKAENIEAKESTQNPEENKTETKDEENIDNNNENNNSNNDKDTNNDNK